MRIRILSDLHFEHHADLGRCFVDLLDPEGTDLLVLAGDITNSRGIREALNFFHGRFLCPIVYVHGNHEFYGSTRRAVLGTTQAWLSTHPRVRWLDNDIAEIGGKRFLGTPLWFKETPLTILQAHNWSDFSCIQGFRKWVYQENAKALNFLRREMREGDIVVSHYLPSPQSTPEKFKGSSSNCFFENDLEHLILERKPALWVHGHTHSAFDYMIGSTRVVCNPFGYLGLETNEGFEEAKVVEL